MLSVWLQDTEVYLCVLQLPVPPALLEISSLNRLMSIASRIVGRDLEHESQEAAAQRWRAWQSAASALGLTSQHLAVALSAQSKALMVHMHMAARHGSGRVSFKVICSFASSHWRSAFSLCLSKALKPDVVALNLTSQCSHSGHAQHAPATKEDSAAPHVCRVSAVSGPYDLIACGLLRQQVP